MKIRAHIYYKSGTVVVAWFDELKVEYRGFTLAKVEYKACAAPFGMGQDIVLSLYMGVDNIESIWIEQWPEERIASEKELMKGIFQ